MIDYKVNINGIDVDAKFSEANTEQIFLPLLRRLTKMQEDKGQRLLVMLAAPPGAGKSTLCSFLEQLSRASLKDSEAGTLDQAGSGAAEASAGPADQAGSGSVEGSAGAADQAGSGAAEGSAGAADQAGSGAAEGSAGAADQAGSGAVEGRAGAAEHAGSEVLEGSAEDAGHAGTDLLEGSAEDAGHAGTGLSGLSGTGLSDLLSAGAEDIKPIQVIGMDGFHMKQDYLLSHSVERDGREVRMVDIKGAPVTFEIGAFLDRVKRVASGENCGWPIYDRHLHNPIDNVIRVEKDIVLLEGNYLLLEEEGWRELSNYADYTISLKADEGMLSDRLVARRLESGHPEKESREFVEFSDMYNARTCLQKSKRADLNLRLREDGEFEVI
ncbi:MAG: hypothetical protein K5989_10350 [Lachnospiraceae bacterium]|nr:hypothetical protein [Lachnospiraceae bacterium]